MQSRRSDRLEIIKTVVIIALATAALALMGLTGYYDELIDRVSLDGADAAAAESAASDYQPGQSSACPLAAVVCLAGGGRYGVNGGEEAILPVFERFSAMFGEALGSASAEKRADAAMWRSCLSGRSVVFDYCAGRSLSDLAGWLGVAAPQNGGRSQAERLALSVGDGEALLYYMSPNDEVYVCSTAVNADELAAAIDEYSDNDAYFAYEDANARHISPYSLLAEPASEVRALSAENPLRAGQTLDALFSALGMSGYATPLYSESDGTRVYVDGEKTLRVSPQGAVTYRLSRRGVDAKSDDAAAALSAALELADSALLGYSGDAKLYLKSFAAGEDGEYTARLCYTADRREIELPDTADAAKITVSGGSVSSAEFFLRAYTLGDGATAVMPLAQALGIASEKNTGRLRLLYTDTGDGVSCDWYLK